MVKVWNKYKVIEMEKLLNSSEAAKYLNIKEWTLRHWVSEKRIPYVKLGRCVRFKQSDLDKYIEQNTHYEWDMHN
mgnify:CR=1 FL=1